MATIDWQKEVQPLIKKYKGKKHPLEYKSMFQLVVMVVLSAQDSDKHINQIALDLFKAFPDMKINIQQIVAEGDTVATRGFIQGTHCGEFMGIPQSGKKIKALH